MSNVRPYNYTFAPTLFWSRQMHSNILTTVLLLALTCISGCAVTPKLDENGEKQVLASTPKSEGEVRFFSIAQWLPNSREFNFAAEKRTPIVAGVVVVADKSILFQQWGGPTGLNIIKRVSLEDIEDVNLISHGLSRRIVIRSRGNLYDSFAASEVTGEVSIPDGTKEMHRVILSLMKKA
jgi:hypothetical protein